MAIFQFRAPSGPPSLDEVAERFGFTESEIDRTYGVEPAPDAGDLYLVRVDDGARERLGPRVEADPDAAVRFFSDPRIEPFGPPQP